MNETGMKIKYFPFQNYFSTESAFSATPYFKYSIHVFLFLFCHKETSCFTFDLTAHSKFNFGIGWKTLDLLIITFNSGTTWKPMIIWEMCNNCQAQASHHLVDCNTVWHWHDIKNISFLVLFWRCIEYTTKLHCFNT